MNITLEQVVERIPAWNGRSLQATPLEGGLTNRMYRLEVDGAPCVVRIPSPATELLAIDRHNELVNTRAAATTGVGPQVLHHLEDLNAMVLSFLPGQTMSGPSLRETGMPATVARTLRRLHAGPRFHSDFDMFATLDFYWQVVTQRGLPSPPGFADLLGAVEAIRQALPPVPSVPCHNDLLAANYLFDGQTMFIVDYEYSGNNDPCFELGNTALELEYSQEQLEELCQAYFGEVRADKLARMRLHQIMADLGWSLWAAISARVSSLEFDFWGWAVERQERAAAALAQPGYPRWLGEAAGAPSNLLR